MDRLIESGINWLNSMGLGFCAYAWSALIQSSALIVALLVLDLLLRTRVRAVVRYAVWMLVFAKLLLPPTLSLPTGIGYYRPGRSAVVQETRVPEASTFKSTDTVAPVYAPPPPAASEIVSAFETPITAAGLESRAVAPIPPVVVRPALNWRAGVFVGWLVGVSILCLCLARRFRYVRRLVAGSAAAPMFLQTMLNQCAARLSLRRCPQLRLSDDVPGPVVCRLLSPVVLMPTALTEKVDADRLEAVLVHELAHIKRMDLWINFVQTILLVAYFYHPLLWLVNAIVRRLREQAVDETVLVALDAEAERYSTTLIDLAEMTLHGPTVGLRLIGIAESKKALEERIRHMMTRPKPRTARIGLWGLLALGLAAAVLLPMARGRSAPPSENSSSSADGDQFEGKLAFNETLPVGLAAGTAEHARLANIESIRFETAYGNAWAVVVRLGWLPVHDATWRLRVELLDDQGQALRHPLDRPVVFTGAAPRDGPTVMRYVHLRSSPMHFEKRRHATRFRLQLEPFEDPSNAEGRTMDVSVVEQGGTRPIPGAVLLVSDYGVPGNTKLRRIAYATDSQGRCQVRLGAKTLYSPLSIDVQKKGCASLTKTWTNRGPSSASRGVLWNLPQSHTFELPPVSTIGGTVRDVNGDPIEAVEVGMTGHLQTPSGRWGGDRRVLSDANGRWRLERVPEGVDRISLRLRHPDFGGDSAYSRQLEGDTLQQARALQRVDTLERGVKLSGTVLGEGGKPVSGAAVLLLQRGDARAQAISGPAGEYSLVCSIERRSVADAPIVLVEAPGYAPQYEPIDIKPKYAPLTFRLQRGKTITARVVDSEGRPVAGARTAVDPLADYEDYGVWLEETDERGEFEIPNVPDNEIRLTILGAGHIAKRGYVVDPSRRRVTIPLEPALAVQGKVTDAATGAPISSFNVAAVHGRGNRSRTSDARAFAEGAYQLSFEEAPFAALRLRVSAAGYQTATSEVLMTGRGRRVLDFQLERAADFDVATAGRTVRDVPPRGVRRFAGVIRDEQGMPVGGATVSSAPWLGAGVVTDADGAFALQTRSFSGMMGGTMGGMGGGGRREDVLWLLVRHKERNLGAAIRLDEAADDLNITLADGLILSGRVTDSDGATVPGAELSFAFQPSKREIGYGKREPTAIDADGRFEIRGIPHGYHYSVRAHADGYGEPSVQAKLGAADGERVELAPLVLNAANLPISGVVVDGAGRPVRNVRVLCSGNGQPHREAFTDTQGKFILEDMCKGRVQLQASTDESRRLRGRARVAAGATDVRIVVRNDQIARPARAVPAATGEAMVDRAVSGTRLMDLGKALRVYADDHDDRFPDRMADAVDCYPINLSWLQEHVVYLGQGKTISSPAEAVLAYDKTLLGHGQETLVLSVNTRVTQRSLRELEGLGIKAVPGKKIDYASVVIEEGVGFNGLVVGDPTCTAALIQSKLGQPYEELKSKKTGWWLDYNDTYGLDFWLSLQTGTLSEIRCNKGFKGHLRSGISMASTRADVFRVYGKPLKEQRVRDLTKHFDNQVWYKLGGLLNPAKNSKIFYRQHGLLFWFEGDKIRQFVIHPKATATGQPSAGVTDQEVRVVSQMRLSDLGKALLIYANDHDDELPDELSDLGDEVRLSMSWLTKNVVYWGKGVTMRDNPVTPIAYDKTLLEKGQGTNVLYLDAHVTFESRTRLEEIGIKPAPKPAAVVQQEAVIRSRVESQTRLMDLGKALLIYANDHDDKFPETLSGLRDEVGVGMSWLQENVTYLGKDISPVRDHPARVLAYDKTLLRKGRGTNVLYLDSHVAFETPKELEKLGIKAVLKPLEATGMDASIQARLTVLSRLKQLALAAHLYAGDHGGVFPGDLKAMVPYLPREKELRAWVRDNAQYVAKGDKVIGGAQGAQKPLAWCPIPSGSSDVVGVAFQDGHAEIVKRARLKNLGIEMER